MIQMGFNTELAKKALIKSKNESLSVALDAYTEVVAAEEKNKPVKNVPKKKLKIISYECPVCTLINGEDKSICDACGTEAPQTAYLIVKDEEEIKKEKDEEDRKAREAEDAKKKELEAEIKK